MQNRTIYQVKHGTNFAWGATSQVKEAMIQWRVCSSLYHQVLWQSNDFPLINNNYTTDLSMNEHVQFTLELEHTHTNTLGMCMCNFDSSDFWALHPRWHVVNSYGFLFNTCTDLSMTTEVYWVGLIKLLLSLLRSQASVTHVISHHMLHHNTNSLSKFKPTNDIKLCAVSVPNKYPGSATVEV